MREKVEIHHHEILGDIGLQCHLEYPMAIVLIAHPYPSGKGTIRVAQQWLKIKSARL